MIKNYIENEKVFAFNIWDVNSAKAIIDAACSVKSNVILQTSSSIYPNIDVELLRYVINFYCEKNNIKIWLHLDHCKSMEIIEDAIKVGYDSVMIDASNESLENNIDISNRVADLAHEKNVLVEAELGEIRGVEDDICCSESRKPHYDDIDIFLRNIRADMIAVAFGNAHGIYKGTPNLDYDIVKYVTSNTDKPFVVHGGSGMSDEMISKLAAIKGVGKINISTDVKYAYRTGILNSIGNGKFDKNGFQAIKVDKDIHDAIFDMAVKKMQLLKGMDE